MKSYKSTRFYDCSMLWVNLRRRVHVWVCLLWSQISIQDYLHAIVQLEQEDNWVAHPTETIASRFAAKGRKDCTLLS